MVSIISWKKHLISERIISNKIADELILKFFVRSQKLITTQILINARSVKTGPLPINNRQ